MGNLDMKLFRLIMDVHQKQIIQQKVLQEIILVIALLIGNRQIADLADCNLSYHIGIVLVALRQQDEQKLSLIPDLQKVGLSDHLTVRRRLYEASQDISVDLSLIHSSCQEIASSIIDT